ncbi:type II toxin-antitoxin system VapC family toxin [Erythrobacter sp. WG]|uniref:type II toxin-antitoxin system VapC family toxin n=1 Tax=Erythrobacter sp. WG TaxID=2985510 RepID=UPI00226E28E9|nr:type II toxin-antitoxin system VapC family toxin [Erythrobacter sp. WG]MCX9147220.1 type II toxin-antitoxin system VapC family toxin [Erythrobacter sp. WG]
MIFDSNIVLDLLDAPPESELYGAIDAVRGPRVHVNEIVYAEVAARFVSPGLLETSIAALDLVVEPLTLLECHRAGQAFAEYRRRGGARIAILPDFLIGAQAATRGWPLVTRDRKGFASYFPELTIIDPLEHIA